MKLHRYFLRPAVAFYLLLLSGLVAANPGPANIILILSDDVGAETLGVYGGESYQTPSLDQLARDGIRFVYGHAQPLCTPSRVKIMTGQYNFRNYTHFSYLDPKEKTVAHMLKNAGYQTAIVGKWQLFNNRFEDVEGTLPHDAGFDEYLLWQVRVERKSSRYWGPLLDHNGEMRQHDKDEYGPDIFNEYVLDYIETHKDEPFFVYYPMVLAHDPWVTTPDMRDESASDQEKFAAMMTYMDKLVGKVRDKVEEVGIADRTVILFIGDNGTGRDIVSRQNGVDVRGAKGRTIDAGSRVPFIAWGPQRIFPGLISDSLVNLNDVLPTLAALADVPLPDKYPGDGQSLVGEMTGKAQLQRDNLFIHYEPRWPSGVPARYAFDRRWKLYEGGGFFDMRSDPLEEIALDVSTLDMETARRYQSLQARIDSMPGELQSKRRWLPPVAYKIMTAAGVGLVLVCWLLSRLVRFLRR